MTLDASEPHFHPGAENLWWESRVLMTLGQ